MTKANAQIHMSNSGRMIMIILFLEPMIFALIMGACTNTLKDDPAAKDLRAIFREVQIEL